MLLLFSENSSIWSKRRYIYLVYNRVKQPLKNAQFFMYVFSNETYLLLLLFFFCGKSKCVIFKVIDSFHFFKLIYKMKKKYHYPTTLVPFRSNVKYWFHILNHWIHCLYNISWWICFTFDKIESSIEWI